MGIADIIRKAAGLRTTQDAEADAALIAERRASSDPADIYAAAIADRVSLHGFGDAMRAMPTVARDGGRWPADHDARWVIVADAARRDADALRRHGMTGVDPRISEVATTRALLDAGASYDGRGDASAHLDRTRTRIGDRVRQVLTTGIGTEGVAHAHALHIAEGRDPAIRAMVESRTAGHGDAEVRDGDPTDPLHRNARTYLAMARAGLVPPADIVAYAMGMPDDQTVRHPSTRPIDWDAAAKATTPEQRQALVSAEIGRNARQFDDEYAGRMTAVRRQEEHRREKEADGRNARRPNRTNREGMGVKAEVVRSSAAAARDQEAQALPHAGYRDTGETVGQRSAREIAEAIEGRERLGDAWRAPAGSMIRPMFLEGDIGDLRNARDGRYDRIGDASFALDMESYARSAGDRHFERDPVQGQVRAAAIGAMGRGAGMA